VIVYLDDILIYSTNREEHDVLVFKVLKILQAEGLTANITKCIFDAESVSFLGFVLFSKDVSLANNIVQTILD
jgi:recombinational DNA repair protein (RecF pathway)